MNDPQSLGLGELGQRVQAMSDPVTDSRLRPYQGAPLPVGPPSNGRPLSAYEPLEDVRMAPPPVPVPAPPPPTPNPYVSQPFQASPPVSGRFSNPATVPTPSPEAPFNPGTTPNPFRSAASAPAPASSWEDIVTPSPAAEPVSAASQTPYAQPAGAPVQPPAAPTAANDPNAASNSGFNRILNAIRSTLPVVQKLLPLIDGNFATAVSALMVQQPAHHTPPPVQVDMEPVERALTEVRNSQRELRGVVLEQVTSLKRVEDQLERVREATDRNTLEQQELVEDLRSVGGRVNTFAVVGLVLLLLSLALNGWLLFQLQHILR